MYVIEEKILNGKFKDKVFVIPNIPMIPFHMRFEFKRLQFAIHLALAVTINKAQGHSLLVSGIYSEFRIFSYGHLHVHALGSVIFNKFLRKWQYEKSLLLPSNAENINY